MNVVLLQHMMNSIDAIQVLSILVTHSNHIYCNAKFERLYNKSKLQVHKEMLKKQILYIRTLVNQELAKNIQNKINNCSNSKELFKFFNSHTKDDNRVLPECQSDIDLANNFGNFFLQKVSNITKAFESVSPNYSLTENNDNFWCSFAPLEPETVYKLRKLKTSLKADNIPIDLYKPLWNCIYTNFADILNRSLLSGVFPDDFKTAVLTPILKSTSLDRNELSSYRPVSNLPYLAKVCETAAANQLSNHLKQFFHPHQSAFRPEHSVESALSHVTSSIFEKLDQGYNVFLVLLDLSAAFDTIDHELLLNILHDRFKVGGTVLKWLQSYLTGRYFRVNIKDKTSDPFPLNVGVPQGSILGPILFNCVMTKLADLLEHLGVNFHIYADDTQLWFAFKESEEENVRSEVALIFANVESFMNTHHLKLNASKTTFLPITRKEKLFQPLLLKPDCSISPATNVRNLGLKLDSNLSFNSYINDLRQSCFHQLKNISQLRQYIPKQMLPQLVIATIISRLDFCNALHCALNNTQLRKIQLIQNACARLLSNSKPWEAITPQLQFLHWLPVKFRFVYKLAVYGHKIIYNQNTPSYLKAMTHIKQPVRLTRSSLVVSFEYPDFNLSTVGGRSVSVGIHKVWNSLPEILRNCSDFKIFKRDLKTFLFSKAYE
jgi:hypothetical protein